MSDSKASRDERTQGETCAKCEKFVHDPEFPPCECSCHSKASPQDEATPQALPAEAATLTAVDEMKRQLLMRTKECVKYFEQIAALRESEAALVEAIRVGAARAEADPTLALVLWRRIAAAALLKAGAK